MDVLDIFIDFGGHFSGGSKMAFLNALLGFQGFLGSVAVRGVRNINHFGMRGIDFWKPQQIPIISSVQLRPSSDPSIVVTCTEVSIVWKSLVSQTLGQWPSESWQELSTSDSGRSATPENKWLAAQNFTSHKVLGCDPVRLIHLPKRPKCPKVLQGSTKLGAVKTTSTVLKNRNVTKI